MKKLLFRIAAIAIILSLGVAAGGYLALIKGAPEIEEVKGYIPSHGTKVYADDDTLIGEFKIEKGEYVSIKKVPEHLIKAIVAVEDSKFWVHKGLDHVAIIRALVKDILAGRIKEGGSTITQQLAKVLFLTPERTIIRKLKEGMLAYRIEQKMTKEEILELYLNKIYFGNGAYGIEMASRGYFGKSVSELDLAEAAMLCGLVKAPSRYSPYRNLDMAKNRQHIVLNRMHEEGYISMEQAEEAYKEPLYLSSLRYKENTPNYFLEFIRKYLEDEYGPDIAYKGGLRVYTTLNRDIQTAAVAELRRGLRRLDKRQGFRGPLGHKDIDLQDETAGSRELSDALMNPGDLMTATVLRVSASKATVRTKGGYRHLIPRGFKVGTEGDRFKRQFNKEIQKLQTDGYT